MGRYPWSFLFNPELNFKSHIANLKSKLSKSLYVLRTVKNTLNSIFHCHLLYANTIWSCSRSSLIIEIFKMQKAAVRLITGSAYNAHTEPLFKKLKILPLPDLITFSKIQFIQRFSQKFLPSSFNDIWVRNSIRNIGENEIQLRNHAQLQNVYSNLAKLDLFPLYNFPKIWEDFADEQLKIIRIKHQFDHNLKEYFLNDLAATISCNRLLCPTCLAGHN